MVTPVRSPRSIWPWRKVPTGKEQRLVEAWNVTTGTGVKVAALDFGVAHDNNDITPHVAARAHFTNGESGDDNYGHAPHVAGHVAAAADTTIGVAGVCPGCRVLDGKVLHDSGIGSSSSSANGIDRSVNNGAKVINMSLGVRASRTLEGVLDNAWNNGAALVAAAGNGGNRTQVHPGACPGVIAVAATDNHDAKASCSTTERMSCRGPRGQERRVSAGGGSGAGRRRPRAARAPR